MKKKTTKQWMVVDVHGNTYAASNAFTRSDAKERHYSDTGYPWSMALAQGDRLARVEITVTGIRKS